MGKQFLVVTAEQAEADSLARLLAPHAGVTWMGGVQAARAAIAQGSVHLIAALCDAAANRFASVSAGL